MIWFDAGEAAHEDGRQLLCIVAEGHATGHPEVCSGISALLYTVAAWIWEKQDDPALEEEAWQACIGKGEAFIRMPRTPETELVFHLVKLGVGLLASVAPDAFRADVRRSFDLAAFGGGEAGQAPAGAVEQVRRAAPGASPRPTAATETPEASAGTCTGEALPEPAADPAALAAERHARAAAFAAARCRSWLAEAEALRSRDPGFDLAAMARDRVFTLLLAGGVPMAAAYRAADVEGVARRAADAARRDLAERIRAGALRPTEAGAASQPAFALRPDPSRLDDGQVRDVLARIDRRERVSFG